MRLPKPEGRLFYLASPYSHTLKTVKEMRYNQVCEAAAILYKKGYALIEPIGSSHPLSKRYALPTGYDFWATRDRLMVSRSDGLIVLKLPGWKESVGVRDEIQCALECGIPVYPVTMRELRRG